MKVPVNFKLPRKLKKELKKGFNRNIRRSNLGVTESPTGICTSLFMSVSYTGSNTRAFRRLCKFARRQERIERDYMKRVMLEEYKSYKTHPIGAIFSCPEK